MNGQGMEMTDSSLIRREMHDAAAVRAHDVELVRIGVESAKNTKPDVPKTVTAMGEGLCQMMQQASSGYADEQRRFEADLPWAKEALERKPGLIALLFGPGRAERQAIFESRLATAAQIHEKELEHQRDRVILLCTIMQATVVQIWLTLIQTALAGNGLIPTAGLLGQGNGEQNAGPIILNRPNQAAAV